MNYKEKAKELSIKFIVTAITTDIEAIESAKVCVDEIITELSNSHQVDYNNIDEWKKVKEELVLMEKLT